MCQRHLLADSAKQLPGEGVPLQGDAAELQGQFQGPASGKGRELEGEHVGEGSWTRVELGPVTPKPRRSEGPWGGVSEIRIHITSEA